MSVVGCRLSVVAAAGLSSLKGLRPKMYRSPRPEGRGYDLPSRFARLGSTQLPDFMLTKLPYDILSRCATSRFDAERMDPREVENNCESRRYYVQSIAARTRRLRLTADG